MFTIYSKNKVKCDMPLITYFDYKVTEEVSSLPSIEFNISSQDIPAQFLETEGYIETEDGMFIIKELNKDEDEINIFAVGDAEELKGNVIKSFSFTTVTVGSAINTLFAQIPSCGWTCQVMNNIIRKRSQKTSLKTAWDNLLDIEKLFHVDLKFNIKEKKIYVYEYNQMGEDKGVYAIDKLNLDSPSIDENTESFATRLYAYGKDNLSFSTINSNKEYIDNNDYSSKVVSAYWIDERYTDAESLLEDAQYKLAELCKPSISYQAKVIDLAAINNTEYYSFTIQLGDMVRIKSDKIGIDIKQRVVKIERYPLEPEKNTITFSTKKKSLADAQVLRQKFVENIEDSFGSDGSVSYIGEDAIDTDNIKDNAITDSKVIGLSANKITAGTIDAANIEVINLKAENITVGTINGNQIAQGAIDMDNLSQAVINEINSGGSTGTKNFYQSTEPTEAGEGDLWFNTAEDNALSIYNNGAWVAYPFGAEALSANCITSEKISTGAITAGKIAAGAIQTTNLASGAVTADKIAAGTITADRIDTSDLYTNYLSSMTINANQITGSAFDLASGTYNVSADSKDNAMVTITAYDNGYTYKAEISAVGATFSQGSNITSIGWDGITTSSIVCPDIWCNGTLLVSSGSLQASSILYGGNELDNYFAKKSHSHSEYYSEGDNIYANRIYISGASNISGSANVRLAVSSPYQIGYASGSSRNFKHDIKPVENEELNPHRLYDIEVVQFKYNDDYLDANDQRYQMDCIGFIAEQVDEVYPIAADRETGEPQNWEMRYLLPPMLALIQEQKKEIDELKKEIAAIKESLGV